MSENSPQGSKHSPQGSKHSPQGSKHSPQGSKISSRRVSRDAVPAINIINASLFGSSVGKPRPGGFLKIPKNPLQKREEKKVVTPVATLQVCRCNERQICEELECEALPPSSGPAASSSLLASPAEKEYDFGFSPSPDTSRSYRINRVLDASHYSSPNSTINESFFDETLGSPRLEAVPLGTTGTVNILGIVISTVMLISSGNKASNDMLDATVAYLNLLLDPSGNVPPNVQGLLNHIMFLRGETPPKKPTGHSTKIHDKTTPIFNPPVSKLRFK